MGLIRSSLTVLGVTILGLMGCLTSVFVLITHVWTIIIAYLESGLFAAVITLVLPVLSAIYWFFWVGFTFGFGTNYCVGIMAITGFYVVIFIIAGIFTFFMEQ